jgi:hypothetical protein
MASGGVARPMDEAAIDVEGLGDAVDRLALGLGQALANSARWLSRLRP